MGGLGRNCRRRVQETVGCRLERRGGWRGRRGWAAGCGAGTGRWVGRCRAREGAVLGLQRAGQRGRMRMRGRLFNDRTRDQAWERRFMARGAADPRSGPERSWASGGREKLQTADRSCSRRSNLNNQRRLQVWADLQGPKWSNNEELSFQISTFPPTQEGFLRDMVKGGFRVENFCPPPNP